jgi:signal transduction histidine kinase
MQQENDILLMMIVTSGLMLLLVCFFVYVVIFSQRKARIIQLEMFNAIIDAQEKEQARIARDLHDHLGPTLSVIKMQIDAISESGLDVLDKQIRNDVLNQMEHAINDLRSIAHNLIPKTFDEYGFIKSLEYYIIRIKEFNNIEIDYLLSNWEIPMDRNFEITLFRILQELFQNTQKHAQASKINLTLAVTNHLLTLHYTDNGKGLICSKNNEPTKGIGINNIINRTKLLGGNMDLNRDKKNEFEMILTFKLNNHYAKK